jgi:hypothetical protein
MCGNLSHSTPEARALCVKLSTHHFCTLCWLSVRAQQTLLHPISLPTSLVLSLPWGHYPLKRGPVLVASGQQ